MNAILQAFLDAMVNDDGSGTTGDLMDKTWWTDLIGRLDTVISLAGLSIEEDQTYYVSPTGSDTTGDGSLAQPWSTIDHALDNLRTYRIAPGSQVMLKIGAGAYTLTSSLHTAPKGLILEGETRILRQITSVQSSSGSSGDYSIVLNVFDVDGIVEGDECAISDATGGTNPLALHGTYEITDVDVVNSRITIHSTTATLPSGAVEATLRVYRTVLNCVGCSGVTTSADIALQHLAIVGDGTADMSGIAPTAMVQIDQVAVRKFSTAGVLCSDGGSVIGDALAISDCGKGILAELGNYCHLTGLIISHTTGSGLYARTSGVIIAPEVSIYAGTNGIECLTSGTVIADSAIIRKAGYGIQANLQGHVIASSASITECSTGIWCKMKSDVMAKLSSITSCTTVQVNVADSAMVDVSSATISGTNAITAWLYSYVKAPGGGYGSLSGTCSPTVNTQGNIYSYIATP